MTNLLAATIKNKMNGKILEVDTAASYEEILEGLEVPEDIEEDKIIKIVNIYTIDGSGFYDWLLCGFRDFKGTLWNFIDYAKTIEELEDSDLDKLEAYVEAYSSDYLEVLDRLDDMVWYPGMTLEEVAIELVDEGCFGTIPNNIIDYIDYEAIARDLSFDGYYESTNGVIYIG